jgi:hypothetical protein
MPRTPVRRPIRPAARPAARRPVRPSARPSTRSSARSASPAIPEVQLTFSASSDDDSSAGSRPAEAERPSLADPCGPARLSNLLTAATSFARRGLSLVSPSVSLRSSPPRPPVPAVPAAPMEPLRSLPEEPPAPVSLLWACCRRCSKRYESLPSAARQPLG